MYGFGRSTVNDDTMRSVSSYFLQGNTKELSQHITLPEPSFIDALNTLKQQSYTTIPSNIVSLYSKEPLGLGDTKKCYGYQQYPGHIVPTFYQNRDEAEQDIDYNNNDNQEIEKFKIVLQQQQSQQEIEDKNVFNINQYFKELNTFLFGNQIIHSKLLSSTQTLSMKYLSNTNKQGIVMVADQQTNGKGRGGNQWVSPIGCLLYSFKCKQSDGNKLPFLQYVAGLAMIEAIHSFPIASDLNVRLKWPNDIYGDNNLKIGGILCQSNYFDNQFDIVIGIGINVTNSNNPTISINQMIHNNLILKKEIEIEKEKEKEIIPVYISRESLLSRFFNVFEQIYITFTKDGFKPLEKRYTDVWLHSNSVVQIKEKDNQYVKIIGLTDNGFLKSIECNSNGIQTSNIIHELHPDGTSFDIENLILKKKEIK
ncbi:hypothetical protein RB653_008732 [Dictyostelium firmibasis]|uniref:BPL/LPL catalytic domain-containing protein n=1 Tax=Dictyostelium firmibasis TaxID=79012 RepID=A0AAN7TT12_9MYCE